MNALVDISAETVFYALFGGVAPALVWLWFWLKEDARHPEPARLIFLTFVAGMIAVPVALLFEKIASELAPYGIALFVAWAAIEEVLKFGAAYVIAFRKECIDRSRCLDEAVDPVIYIITAALGFAALENTLFLLSPLAAGEPVSGFITGNLRFLGAMVLHALASGAVGIAMGFSFYKKPLYKRIYVLLGIFTAILLHALFNISIIKSDVIGSEGYSLFIIFGVLWVGVFVLLAFFEHVKRIRKKQTADNEN